MTVCEVCPELWTEQALLFFKHLKFFLAAAANFVPNFWFSLDISTAIEPILANLFVYKDLAPNLCNMRHGMPDESS